MPGSTFIANFNNLKSLKKKWGKKLIIIETKKTGLDIKKTKDLKIDLI